MSELLLLCVFVAEHGLGLDFFLFVDLRQRVCCFALCCWKPVEVR